MNDRPTTITADPQYTIHVIGPDDKVIMVVPATTPIAAVVQYQEQFEHLLGPNKAVVVYA